MKSEKQPLRVPVKTPVGYLYGRDAIYLDRLEYEGGSLILQGEINGRLASDIGADRMIGYTLRFLGTLAFKSIELDSWDFVCETCFDEILNSEWVVTLGGKVTPNHAHYVIQTYDDVIDVVCKRFELTIKESKTTE